MKKQGVQLAVHIVNRLLRGFH